jgi:hypothetical protein
LYDMQADPGQREDVSRKHPQVAKRLTEEVARWRQEVLGEMAGPDDRPFTVGYREFPITQLPARDGVGHGNIERSAKAPNCSFYTNWKTADDFITWDVAVATPGPYEAVVYYTCAKENVGVELELTLGERRWQATVSEPHDPPLYGSEHDRASRGSESLVKEFKPLSLGTVTLDKGRGTLRLGATKVPGNGAIDVRMVVLTLVEP